MRPPIRNTLQRSERLFFRLLTLCLCVAIACGIWLSRVGLPQALGNALMRRIDTGSFAIEASCIRLGLIKGVRLDEVCVYRKGVVGKPTVEAESVVLWVDPLAMLRGMSTVQRVEISDGQVRPRRAFTSGNQADPDMTLGSYQTQLALNRCQVDGVMVEAMQGHLRLDDTILQVNDIRSTVSRDGMRGTATGHLSYDCRTQIAQGQAELSMYPAIVEPVLEAWDLGGLAGVFRRFTFEQRPPKASLTYLVSIEAGGPIRFEGDAHADAVRYRDVWAKRVDTTLEVARTNGTLTVTLDPLSVVRNEGSLQGMLAVDLGAERVHFNVQSSLNPHLGRQAIGILSDPFWDRWAFNGPVVLRTQGVVGYESLAGTDFSLQFDGRDLAYTNHAIESCRFDVRMVDDTVALSNLHARLYGGEATGRAEFTVPPDADGHTAFETDVRVTNMNFEQLVAVLRGKTEQEYRGRFSGMLALNGRLGEAHADTIRGEGSIVVKEGRVFMLPVFGGLSEIMTRLIPGLDFVLRQSDAVADFKVADSKVSTDSIEINGKVLSLKGRGHYAFDHRVDFHAQVKLMTDNNMVTRLVRVVTFPLSKLFEFRLRGLLEDPQWYPENFSSDLLEKIGLKKAES